MSDVEAQAARGDPADRGSWPRPVRQAVLEALSGLGGQEELGQDTPTPFVNLVYCKSNTSVFFTLLAGWVPNRAAGLLSLLTCPCSRACPGPAHRLPPQTLPGPRISPSGEPRVASGAPPPWFLWAGPTVSCVEAAAHPQPLAELSPPPRIGWSRAGRRGLRHAAGLGSSGLKVILEWIMGP